MAIPFLMTGHVLAEKYCGAPSRPLRAKILPKIVELGCGSETEIYVEIASSLSKMENIDLAGLATGGDTTLKLSASQLEEWAATTTEVLGGCAALVREHDAQ